MPGPRNKMSVKLLRKRLDDAGVVAHFQSLARDAKEIEIRVKDEDATLSNAASELAETARRLRTGEVLAVQIRFFADDAWWCDTVLRKGDSYRLVRMRQS